MTGFFKALMSAEAAGDYLIETIQILYRRSKDEHPGDDPHVVLANTWLRKKRIYARDNDTLALAYLVTAGCACLPEPSNARMLGYQFMQQRMPDLLEKFPRFAEEAEELSRPIRTLRRQPAEILRLYQSLNPNQDFDGMGLTALQGFLETGLE